MRPRADSAQEHRDTSGRAVQFWETLTPAERAAHTTPGRRAFLAKFEALVPADVTDPDERAAQAEELRKQHFSEMGRRSAEARRAARSKTLRRRAQRLLEQAEAIEAGDAR